MTELEKIVLGGLGKCDLALIEWLCKEMLADQTRFIEYTEERELRCIDFVFNTCKNEPAEEVERTIEFIRTMMWTEIERVRYEEEKEAMELFKNADEATRQEALTSLRKLKKNTAPGVGSTEDGKSGKVDS